MPKIVVRSGLMLKGFPARITERLSAQLTYDNPKFLRAQRHSGLPKWAITKIPKDIAMYEEFEDDALRIPRGVSLREIFKFDKKLRKKTKIVDKRTFNEVEFPKALLKPFPEQREVLKQIADDIASGRRRPFNNYLIKMHTSGGKTILAALIAALTGQKTLIVGHMKMIKRVWFKELKHLFGLTTNEVGLIQGKAFRFGEQFTYAMYQTLVRLSPDKLKEMTREFGCVIFDECHICPAPTFQTYADIFPAAYRIGITATPERQDGMHKILYRIFGTILFDGDEPVGETETSLPIKDVIAVKCKTVMPLTIKKKFKGKIIDIEVDGNRDFGLYLKTICADKVRNRKIARDVVKAVRKNHVCLISTIRKEHAYNLAEIIGGMTKFPGAILTGDLSETEEDNIVKLIEKRKIRWIVATQAKISKGASLNTLDRLFIVTSIKEPGELKQLCGRIRRKHKDKKSAIVRDYYEPKIPISRRHFFQHRVNTYRELGVERYRNMFVC